MKEVVLDGAVGEGGGQILRTALSLSMITGIPFEMVRIRAKRHKPGLLRQHLTAVKAAAALCDAAVCGAELGASQLRFVPGRIRAGNYQFAIGSAGSCNLVLQTVLPALWFADGPSMVTVSGGTHNRAAPPINFLQRVWSPLLARMGVHQTLELMRHGFYPAGGGLVRAAVEPCAALLPVYLLERGARLGLQAEAIVAAVPGSVARREIERLQGQLAYVDGKVRELPRQEGPGNALLLEIRHEGLTEMICGFGEPGLSAEAVADAVAREAWRYLGSPAAVGEHLADQLLLPMALAGSGALTCVAASSHLLTNIGVIEQFLPVQITHRVLAEDCHRLDVARTSP